MKPREELIYAAIHEAGHVAACINLGLEFGEVNISPRKEPASVVMGIMQNLPVDRYSVTFTAEEESRLTDIIIMAFAGPAAEALHRGRPTFLVSDYPDLNDVLDIIEERFHNHRVRKAYTQYCIAESFALFEDDSRLWKYVYALARELTKHKKRNYFQCLDLYEKEYLGGMGLQEVKKEE